MIKTHCPSCQQKLNAPLKLAGKTVRCPKCSGTITVPTVQNSPANTVQPAKPGESPVPMATPVNPVTPSPDIDTGIPTAQSVPAASGPVAVQVASSDDRLKRHQRKSSGGLTLALAALALIGVLAGGYYLVTKTSQPAFTLSPIDDVKMEEHQSITIPVNHDAPAGLPLSFSCLLYTSPSPRDRG